MEHPKWEKDQTPYVVFRCSKCRQYSYVKTTQKTKKCLRCGRTHQVKSIVNQGQIVNGISAAMNFVKKMQNALAEASFEATREFKVSVTPSSEESITSNSLQEIFYKLIKKIASEHSKFPKYLIDLTAPEYHIPARELPILIQHALREGRLYKKENNYFAITK